MSKSIFISHVHEDRPFIENVKRWTQQNLLGNVVITSEVEDMRLQGKQAIKRHIQNKIVGAAAIVVLVGKDTHNHDWIETEVELANSFSKEIICMRIPQTTGALPKILMKYKIINFNPDSLKKEIDKLK